MLQPSATRRRYGPGESGPPTPPSTLSQRPRPTRQDLVSAACALPACACANLVHGQSTASNSITVTLAGPSQLQCRHISRCRRGRGAVAVALLFAASRGAAAGGGVGGSSLWDRIFCALPTPPSSLSWPVASGRAGCGSACPRGRPAHTPARRVAGTPASGGATADRPPRPRDTAASLARRASCRRAPRRRWRAGRLARDRRPRRGRRRARR